MAACGTIKDPIGLGFEAFAQNLDQRPMSVS